MSKYNRYVMHLRYDHMLLINLISHLTEYIQVAPFFLKINFMKLIKFQFMDRYFVM